PIPRCTPGYGVQTITMSQPLHPSLIITPTRQPFVPPIKNVFPNLAAAKVSPWISIEPKPRPMVRRSRYPGVGLSRDGLLCSVETTKLGSPTPPRRRLGPGLAGHLRP